MSSRILSMVTPSIMPMSPWSVVRMRQSRSSSLWCSYISERGPLDESSDPRKPRGLMQCTRGQGERQIGVSAMGLITSLSRKAMRNLGIDPPIQTQPYLRQCCTVVPAYSVAGGRRGRRRWLRRCSTAHRCKVT